MPEAKISPFLPMTNVDQILHQGDRTMTKIILADNQAIFRTGAAKVLAVEDDLRIVAQCDARDRLRSAVDSFRNAIVLVATSVRPDFQQTALQLKEVASRGIIIGEDAENPRSYMDLGLHGFIHRDITGQALVNCVRTVARGEKWVQNGDSRAEDDMDLVGARVRDRLTPKEMKIVGLIVQGFKNKEIANTLGTTEQVIKNYLRSVYDKTGVSDRLELALFTIHHRVLAEAAAQAGLIVLKPAS
jgi:DNA-binding NarL/FixJ family response regulator